MKQSTRDSLIVLGLLLAIVVVATVVVYAPQMREVARLKAEIAEQELHLADCAEKARGVPMLVRDVREMRARYSNFDRRLPQKKELGGFLREISGNVSEGNLWNHVIEPGNPTRTRLFNTLPITLRFQGSYLALARFLRKLGAMERLTQIQRLHVCGRNEASRDSKGPEKVDVELLMNIYFTES